MEPEELPDTKASRPIEPPQPTTEDRLAALEARVAELEGRSAALSLRRIDVNPIGQRW